MKNIMELIREMFWGSNKCSCKDIDYLTKRIETLSEELSLCIGPVDIIEEHKTEVSPYDAIYGYDMVAADAKYLTYTFEDWQSIMFRLHRHIGDKFKYNSDISDCDDFALLYASTLAYSAYREGLSKQPAFAIAWSYTHAFNLFIDDEDTAWIVEPQLGTIIGRLGENNGDSYDVKKIWFMS